MSLQAGAALRGAGPEGTGATGQSDLTGLDGASWSLDVIWRVLRINDGDQLELVQLWIIEDKKTKRN